jgi:hypothetical protein
MNGLWYCPAYCATANQIREFRIKLFQQAADYFRFNFVIFPNPLACSETIEYNTAYINKEILRGRVKSPTGGTVRDPLRRLIWCDSITDSKVWMREECDIL